MKECSISNQLIENEYYFQSDEKYYHSEHFVCKVCKCDLNGQLFFDLGTEILCEKHYHEIHAKKCEACGNLIIDSYIIAQNEQCFHKECFQCNKCFTNLTSFNYFFIQGEYFNYDQGAFCIECFEWSYCEGCQQRIMDKILKYQQKNWHTECFEKHKQQITENLKFLQQNIDQDKDQQDNRIKFENIDENTQAKNQEQQIEDRIQKIYNKEQIQNQNQNNDCNEKDSQTNEQIRILNFNLEQQKIKENSPEFIQQNICQIDNPIQMESYKYNLQQLQQRPYPEDIDPTMRETYLSNKDFFEVFKMDKIKFNNLPKWRQIKLKKDLNLF